MNKIIVICLVLLTAVSYGTTIIYQEDFAGPAGTDLNGRTPTVAPAGIAWLAGTDFDADGTVTYSTSGLGDTAYLPFVPENGKIYQLSATLDARQVSGQSADNWLALGFTQQQVNPSLRFFADGGTSSYPVCWGMTRTSATASFDQTFIGPDTATAATTDTKSADQIVITLNTSSSTWEATWYYNGTLKRTAALPDSFKTSIRYIAISSARCSGTVDNLLLSATPAPSFLTHPVDTSVVEPVQALLQASFQSPVTPTAAWYRVVSSGEVQVVADSRIQTSLVYDSVAQIYIAKLTFLPSQVADSGRYYCRIISGSQTFNSQAASLQVLGLVARWPMDQSTFVSGKYKDIIGGYDAAAEGSPTFTTGADGGALGAVVVTPDSGWASVNSFDPKSTGQMTISLWVNWLETSVTQDNLVMSSIPDGNSLEVQNGLKAGHQWQQICAVFDGQAGKLYLDGKLRDQGAWTLPADMTSLLNIGSAETGRESFRGELDDLRVYNYALSDMQVADIFHAMSGRCVCILDYKSQYDFSGPMGQPDCKIDIYDLAVFSQQWLTGYVLQDFAELSKGWLTCGLYPNCP